MAKYVCDFDAINDAVSELDNLSGELETLLQKEQSSISSDLVTWKGNASTSFQNSEQSIVSGLEADIKNMQQMSEYLKQTAKTIEDAENDLASLTI